MLVSPPAILQNEPNRPQFHFTAKAGWLNDPNGLVFFKGDYHLFFQHNPAGVQWGNMTWGHAVSRDLVHWTQMENALSPDSLGTMFSGSAVVDKGNMSGLGAGAMVVFYTAAGGTNDESKGKPFSQCMAWSLDGKTLTKYDKNPVLPHIEGENRDPKVVWHEPTKQWVMALYLADDRYALFGSTNLTIWSKLCDVKMPGTGECPDFYEMAVEGDKKTKFWVFSGANGNYRLGSFDGKEFKPVTEVLRSNYGSNSYAAQTYSNVARGRRIQIAWMNGSDFPGAAWNQQMSLPRTLTLRATALGTRLFTEPAEELRTLRQRRLRPLGVTDGLNREYESQSGLIELNGDFAVPASGELTIRINGQSVSYSVATKELVVGATKTLVLPDKGKLRLHVFVDRASIEVFAQDGLYSIPVFALSDPVKKSVQVTATGDWRVEELTVYELRSAWSNQRSR